MAENFFDTPIEYLKGVGPQRAELLKKELGIFSFNDLLKHYPFRYVDRTKFHKISEVQPDMPYIQIKGQFVSFHTEGNPRSQRLTGTFEDISGSIDVVWFRGTRWILKALEKNTEYIIFGKPSVFKGAINIIHPDVEKVTPESFTFHSALEPVYSTSEKLQAKGLHSKGIAKLQKTLLSSLRTAIPENLPEHIQSPFRLISHHEAIVNIHLPKNEEVLRNARFRLKFEEFFFIQLQLLRIKAERTEKYKGFVFSRVGNFFNRFYKEKLPFPLTNAQKKVMKEIRHDLGSGKQMNRLLQGDVGSGKTVVSLMSMLIALDNGYQAALMAPTEILAAQHYRTLSQLTAGTGVYTALLTGSLKTKEKKEILAKLAAGEIHILTGTHALIEDTVKFRNLGLVVIDEQHRFGVEQRAKLWRKSGEASATQEKKSSPHVLIMTATPIPRTLAMTLYGDLDTSVIDELPPGRTPVKTVHRYESSRLRIFAFMKKQIAEGRQVYVVYPLIEESEKTDYKNLMDGYEAITHEFCRPQYHVSIVHGQMKPADKNFEMQRFIKGQTHIMVATTVIEVGVDVPNASVMIIESAERFGLSQLHQLRGRVGRGAKQSYCILITGDKISADAKVRMDTMVLTTDGFEIAETDMRLRGPGDMGGTQQSGIPGLSIADLGRDGDILQLARKSASTLLEEDPRLELKKNIILRRQIELAGKNRISWSRIS